MTDTIQIEAYPAKRLQQLIPLFGIIFIDSLAFFLVIPVLLRIFLNPHYDILPSDVSVATRTLLYSLTVAMAMLAFILTSPLIGNLSDRLGRKKLLAYCLSSSVAGYCLPILGLATHQWWLIIVGRFLTGAASSSQPIAQAAIADISAGKRKAFYLSLIAFAMTLALLLGPLLGGFLSDETLSPLFTLCTPYWVGMLLTSLNLILLWRGFHDSTQVLDRTNTEHPLLVRLKNYTEILTQNRLLLLLLAFLFLEIAWGQYYQASFLILRNAFQLSTDHVALFASYAGVWMSIGLTLIYRIAIHRWSVERILQVGYLGASLSFLGCFLTPTLWGQWVFVIPMAVCVGIAYASLLADISDRTAITHQGWVLGTASMLLGLGWLITSLSTGILVNWHIYAPNALAAAAGFAGLACLIVAHLPFKSSK